MAKARTIEIPPLFDWQNQILAEAKTYNVVAVGRQAGKTDVAAHILAGVSASQGQTIAWVVPLDKYRSPTWDRIVEKFEPVITHKDENKGEIDFINGGKITFYTSKNNDGVTRGTTNDKVICDESGEFPNLIELLNGPILATLAIKKGQLWIFGTPKGRNDFYTLFERGNHVKKSADFRREWKEWKSWQMPSSVSPLIDQKFLDSMRRQMPDRIYRQEYEAYFDEGGGGVFGEVRNLVRADGAIRVPYTGGSVVIGVDVAAGRGGDYIVMTALDDQGVQLGIERYNDKGLIYTRERIYRMATLDYPGATVVMDGNSIGETTTLDLQEALGPESVINFKITHPSKLQLINHLIVRCERGDLTLLNHPDQLAELEAFEAQMTKGKKLTYAAPSGQNDDCVIALALACRGQQVIDQIPNCFYF